MLVVGLTGGIATGKSTVSKLLSTVHHIPVIDADILAREAVAPGTSGLSRIVSVFGPSVLLPDGTLDRKKLGSIVFNDEARRKQLNNIVHPAVRWKMIVAVLKYWVKGVKVCVLDVPLLVEGGLWKWVGMVVVVYCSPKLELERLKLRDSSTHEDAVSRLSSQMSIEEKVAYADVVIDNSSSLQDLEREVDMFVKKLKCKTGGWWWLIYWLVPPLGALAALQVLTWRAFKRSMTYKRIKKM